MKYNSEKEIWYLEEDLRKNPPVIDDFEKYLSIKISERVKIIKNDYGLTQREMNPSRPSLIGNIMKAEFDIKSRNRNASFISSTIIYYIIEATKKKKNHKGNRLPKIITPFWIVFGNEQDLQELVKRVYYNKCFHILANKQNSSWEREIIQDLFYADASFSFIYGQAKLNNRTININSDEKELRALVSAIKYTWSIISDEAVTKFKESFDKNDWEKDSDYFFYNTTKINHLIEKWYSNELVPYLKDKSKELKNDSIANIGYCVHNLMERMYVKQSIDKKDTVNKRNENLESLLDESNRYLLDCAKNLEKSQRTYFEKMRNCELIKSIEERVDELGDYELEGDFYEVGTNRMISFDDSGKTFEEALSEAIKSSKNK